MRRAQMLLRIGEIDFVLHGASEVVAGGWQIPNVRVVRDYDHFLSACGYFSPARAPGPADRAPARPWASGLARARGRHIAPHFARARRARARAHSRGAGPGPGPGPGGGSLPNLGYASRDPHIHMPTCLRKATRPFLNA